MSKSGLEEVFAGCCRRRNAKGPLTWASDLCTNNAIAFLKDLGKAICNQAALFNALLEACQCRTHLSFFVIQVCTSVSHVACLLGSLFSCLLCLTCPHQCLHLVAWCLEHYITHLWSGARIMTLFLEAALATYVSRTQVVNYSNFCICRLSYPSMLHWGLKLSLAGM